MRTERVMRIGIVAAIVTSCAHNAAIQPPPSPIPSPPPCLAPAPSTPPPAKREISEVPPRVRSASPTEGTTAGGEEISIFGEGFLPAKTIPGVLLGRFASPAVTLVSANEIRVLIPPGNEGQVDITVMFGDGTVFKIAKGFRYVERSEPEDR